jgi:hypothetical protein
LRVLAGVFNSIEHDGRVQRASEAESEIAEVTVASVASGTEYRNHHFTNVRIGVPAKAGPLAHLCFWLKFWVHARACRPDIVHAHDFFMALPGWIAAKITGAKFVYDAHELITPESGVAMSRRDKFWYLLERCIVGRADLVIAANHERARLMRDHYGLPAIPLVVDNIPPVPLSVLSDEDVRQRYPALARRRTDECLVVYQGDIDVGRGIDQFVQALRLLPDHFRMIMIGGGPDLGRFEAEARSGMSDRLSVLGRVPRDVLHDLLRQCDIGIVTYSDRGQNNLFCAPNKVYEYAQAGLVLMCSDNPVLNRILSEHKIGEAAKGEHEIATALARLHANLADFRREITSFLRARQWSSEAARLREALALL